MRKKVYIVINEDTLQVEGEYSKTAAQKLPAVFKTYNEADEWASERLNRWLCVSIDYFNALYSKVLYKDHKTKDWMFSKDNVNFTNLV